MAHNQCTDLGEVFVTLDGGDCCPDCIDCRDGCCPIWLKMACEVDNQYAPLLNSPTGGLECWHYAEVVEAVEQGWVDEALNPAQVTYGPHIFQAYREGWYTEMVATCNSTQPMNLSVNTNEYRNYISWASQSYSSTGGHTPSGADCNSWQCHDPIWLGGFWGFAPSLVYQGPNKLHWVDPSQGIPAGSDPDCCNTAGFNNGCDNMFAAVEATWGSIGTSALYSNTGIFGTGTGCRFVVHIKSGDPRVSGDQIPNFTQLFPGFDPIFDHTICRVGAPTITFPFVEMYCSYQCDGTITAFVRQLDQPLCNSTNSPPGCGAGCPWTVDQLGSYTSPPGQTLPFAVRIPTTKKTTYAGPPGAIYTVPGPGVEFTLDWMP